MEDAGHTPVFTGLDASIASFSVFVPRAEAHRAQRTLPSRRQRLATTPVDEGLFWVSRTPGGEIAYLHIGRFSHPIFPRTRIWRVSAWELVVAQPTPTKYWIIRLHQDPEARPHIVNNDALFQLDEVLSGLCAYRITPDAVVEAPGALDPLDEAGPSAKEPFSTETSGARDKPASPQKHFNVLEPAFDQSEPPIPSPKTPEMKRGLELVPTPLGQSGRLQDSEFSTTPKHLFGTPEKSETMVEPTLCVEKSIIHDLKSPMANSKTPERAGVLKRQELEGEMVPTPHSLGDLSLQDPKSPSSQPTSCFEASEKELEPELGHTPTLSKDSSLQNQHPPVTPTQTLHPRYSFDYTHDDSGGDSEHTYVGSQIEALAPSPYILYSPPFSALSDKASEFADLLPSPLASASSQLSPNGTNSRLGTKKGPMTPEGSPVISDKLTGVAKPFEFAWLDGDRVTESPKTTSSQKLTPLSPWQPQFSHPLVAGRSRIDLRPPRPPHRPQTSLHRRDLVALGPQYANITTVGGYVGWRLMRSLLNPPG